MPYTLLLLHAHVLLDRMHWYACALLLLLDLHFIASVQSVSQSVSQSVRSCIGVPTPRPELGRYNNRPADELFLLFSCVLQQLSSDGRTEQLTASVIILSWRPACCYSSSLVGESRRSRHLDPHTQDVVADVRYMCVHIHSAD